jgi:hypothetical protein
MSRFYATAVNGRGNEVSIGGRGNAGKVHLRGWDAGVKVKPHANSEGQDEFLVYMTSGSHASSGDVLIGKVTSTPNGPRFAYSEDYSLAFSEES